MFEIKEILGRFVDGGRVQGVNELINIFLDLFNSRSNNSHLLSLSRPPSLAIVTRFVQRNLTTMNCWTEVLDSEPLVCSKNEYCAAWPLCSEEVSRRDTHADWYSPRWRGWSDERTVKERCVLHWSLLQGVQWFETRFFSKTCVGAGI